jgi:hypothetical protein
MLEIRGKVAVPGRRREENLRRRAAAALVGRSSVSEDGLFLECPVLAVTDLVFRPPTEFATGLR